MFGLITKVLFTALCALLSVCFLLLFFTQQAVLGRSDCSDNPG